MNLKKHLKSIAEEVQKSNRDIDLNKLKTDMIMAAALLQNDDTEVPANLFALFDNDMRKGAMMAIIQVYAQAAAE